jgi:hypothetical protein
MREKPVHSRPRRLVDWSNLMGTKKVHSLIDQVYKRKNLEMAWEKSPVFNSFKKPGARGGPFGESMCQYAIRQRRARILPFRACWHPMMVCKPLSQVRESCGLLGAADPIRRRLSSKVPNHAWKSLSPCSVIPDVCCRPSLVPRSRPHRHSGPSRPVGSDPYGGRLDRCQPASNGGPGQSRGQARSSHAETGGLPFTIAVQPVPVRISGEPDRAAVQPHGPTGRESQAHPGNHSQFPNQERRPAESTAPDGQAKIHSGLPSNGGLQCSSWKSVSGRAAASQ